MGTGLADRIARRLETLGLTARSASLAAGIGPDGIRNILRGKSANPRRDTIAKLAVVLGLEPADLMDDTAQGQAAVASPRRAASSSLDSLIASGNRMLRVVGTAAEQPLYERGDVLIGRPLYEHAEHMRLAADGAVVAVGYRDGRTSEPGEAICVLVPVTEPKKRRFRMFNLATSAGKELAREVVVDWAFRPGVIVRADDAEIMAAVTSISRSSPLPSPGQAGVQAPAPAPSRRPAPGDRSAAPASAATTPEPRHRRKAR